MSEPAGPPPASTELPFVVQLLFGTAAVVFIEIALLIIGSQYERSYLAISVVVDLLVAAMAIRFLVQRRLAGLAMGALVMISGKWLLIWTCSGMRFAG